MTETLLGQGVVHVLNGRDFGYCQRYLPEHVAVNTPANSHVGHNHRERIAFVAQATGQATYVDCDGELYALASF